MKINRNETRCLFMLVKERINNLDQEKWVINDKI